MITANRLKQIFLMTRIIFLFFTLSFSLTLKANPKGFVYSVVEFDKHKVHLVKIDPQYINIELVSGHNSVFGREKVGEIVEREMAYAGVNAGFFEIGHNKDGMPSGTLIISGQFFGLLPKTHACLIYKDGNFIIEDSFTPSLRIKSSNVELDINKFNRFADNNEIYIFNDKWGKNTLSSFAKRQEIIINGSFKIIAIKDHGNNEIPYDGYVISLPKNHPKFNFKVGDKVNFNWQPEFLSDRKTFAIMTIPYLIKDGQINPKLNTTAKSNSFMTENARTAFGINKSGEYVIAVAEHVGNYDYKNLSLKDINNILVKENINHNNLDLQELQKIIIHKMQDQNFKVGLTLQELAQFMQQQGCVNAINLDGGGSSSLFIDGKYVNEAFGDKDENNNIKMHRAISNAFIFKACNFK